jgi:hypothetical protein
MADISIADGSLEPKAFTAERCEIAERSLV